MNGCNCSAIDALVTKFRDQLFAVRGLARPLSETMYDSRATIDRYDTVKARKEGFTTRPSTMTSWYELEFLAYLERIGAGKVLDVGCGAGAFFHLLESRFPGRFGYLGIDLSRGQVEAAERNFPGQGRFAVRDLAEIVDFREFDVVHAYSVFSFMSVKKQLDVIERICRTSRLLLDTSFTCPAPHYAPRSFYREHRKGVFTAVNFPYLRDLAPPPGHTVSVQELDYEAPLHFNEKMNDASVAPFKMHKTLVRRLYQNHFGRPRKRLQVKIRPLGWTWTPPDDGASRDEIFRVYASMLSDTHSDFSP